jgi:hypothetical protein
MGKVHHVKAARKDNPQRGIKKGQPYWWAAYRAGRGGYKRYWTKPPRPSQIAASEYAQSVLAIQEEMQDFTGDASALVERRDEWAAAIREIADDCQSKFDNMPDGLQQGDTGQLLEERSNDCETWADAVESVDIDEDAEDMEDEVSCKIDEILSDCPL